MHQLAVIGLGTMGANIARNAGRCGVHVPIYNRTVQKTTAFMKKHGSQGDFVKCKDLKEVVASLARPRPILLMVPAGRAVDAVLEELAPLLEEGDIIIDGGNSHYLDTERRSDELEEHGIHFLGMGISGGEEGALKGPSMMPGGSRVAYDQMREVLELMAADDGEGGRCVSYIGPGGSGHFVKTVHNGIEYGVMQLLAESMDLLKKAGGMSNVEIADVFGAWNQTEELGSFLLEISEKIMEKKEGKASLIDKIADRAKQKGTGKWTTDAAMTLGVPTPTINAAVDARIISGDTAERALGKKFPHATTDDPSVPQPAKLRTLVRSAYELSLICAYNQGFRLIEAASRELWDGRLTMSEVARIWRGGCIIRATKLKRFQNAYSTDQKVSAAAAEHLMERFDQERQQEFRQVVTLAVNLGIPVPGMSSALSYLDALVAERLPQYLVQAQRDYFGAHTYERIDKEGVFHTNWN